MPAVGRASRRILLVLSACAGGIAIHRTPVLAQTTAGVGDDAIPVPRGAFRYSIGASWRLHDEVYRRGPAGSGLMREPLLARLDGRALDAQLLPQLGPVEQAIRALTNNPNFTVSLGTLEARAQARETRVPMAVDYGISSRLSVGVLVPYVEARTTTRFVLNRDGTGATVGRNPAALPTGAAARATNGALLRQLAEARTTLQGEITRCTTSGGTGCAPILANVAAAQQLVSRAAAVQAAVGAVYGDSVGSGSFVVPIAGSATQAAVVTSLDAIRTAFSTYGIDLIASSLNPVGASVVLGPGSLAGIAADTSLGLGYRFLGNTRRAGIGDVDLTATFLLFDSFGGDQHRRLAPSGVHLRSSLTGGFRFGTGTADHTDDPFDIATGLGSNALLARSTTDLVVGRRFWVSASVRLAQPLADDVAALSPPRADSTLLFPFSVVPATRTPGTRLRIELSPRAAFGEFFGVSAGYALHRTNADRFAPHDATIAPWETPTRSLHVAAFGLTYSTLASHARGKSRLPVEVFYVHTEPVAASGNLVPAVASDRLELRIYTGFPRR